MAACVHWVPASGRNHHLLRAAHRYLAGIDENTLKTMRAGFNPPVPARASRRVRRRIKPGAWLAGTVRTLLHYPGAAASWTLTLAKKTKQLIQPSRKTRRVLTGLALAVAGLVVNTIGHLTVAETPAGEKVPPPAKAIVIADPFTLQVAAYLKPEYAISTSTSYFQFCNPHGHILD